MILHSTVQVGMLYQNKGYTSGELRVSMKEGDWDRLDLSYEGKDKRRLLVVLNLQVDTGLFVRHHRNPLVQVGPSLNPKLITNCYEDNGPPSSMGFNIVLMMEQ